MQEENKPIFRFYANVIKKNGGYGLSLRKESTDRWLIKYICDSVLENHKFDFQGEVVFRHPQKAKETLTRLKLI